MARRRTIPAAIALVAGLLAACGGGQAPRASGTTSPGSTPARNPAALVEGAAYRVAIDPANFVAKVDNPWFPLVPGTVFTYEGVADGERESNVVTVTHETKTILGVTTTVVRDEVFVGGELTEFTLDWYAQDRQGNVWYLGEDTKEYENGKVSTTKGSWEAGVDGAQPGIAMLGDPRVGDRYRQEFYRAQAEDLGRVLRLDASVAVPFGSYTGALVTEDTSAIEPALLEHKYYARGVGFVAEQDPRSGAFSLKLVKVTAGG